MGKLIGIKQEAYSDVVCFVYYGYTNTSLRTRYSLMWTVKDLYGHKLHETEDINDAVAYTTDAAIDQYDTEVTRIFIHGKTDELYPSIPLYILEKDDARQLQ